MRTSLVAKRMQLKHFSPLHLECVSFCFYVGESLDSNSNNMSITLILYIFPPMVLLALIIVVILFVRKNRAADRNNSSRGKSNRDTDNHENNDQTISENDVVNTEPDQDRKRDKTFAHYENSNNVPVFLYDSSNFNLINGQVITAA